MDFKKMQRDVHENSVKHGFWDGHVSPHASHGHGSGENGPDEPDCPCRTTAERDVCAAHGCGFCRAAAGRYVRVVLHGGEENRLVPTKLALIHSEVSEALECYRNGEMQEFEAAPGDKPVGLPSELADIVIRTMDLAEALGIDLEATIERKHAYNKTRPYKHGGKAI